jgi:hypothetical protein
VLLRDPDPRLRAAFGLATIMSKLGFFMKGELASLIKPEYRMSDNWNNLGRTEKCRHLALITAKSLSKQDLRRARKNKFEGGGRLFLEYISRHLDLKGGTPLAQRDSFRKWLQKYDNGNTVRFGINKGQKRYVRWMRRSDIGIYAIEAIGSGTRMMPLERFFKFWWRHRRERIAWRPLYCVSGSPIKRPELTFQAGIDLVGQRYVNLLELVLVAIRTNLTSRPESSYEDLSMTVRRRFFCSEFTTAALKRMKLIEEKSIIDGHVQPGDYGSDYGEYAVNNFLEGNWQFAELVNLIEGDDVHDSSRVRMSSDFKSIRSTPTKSDNVSSGIVKNSGEYKEEEEEEEEEKSEE